MSVVSSGISHLSLMQEALRRTAEGLRMEPKRVLIVAGHSLFADGTANRLLQYPEQVDVQRLNPADEDLLEKAIEARPSVIIMDQRDPEIGQSMSLERILRSLPGVQVLLLDPQNAEIQVVSSRTREPVEVEDLLALISNSS
jgi:chemotaxis response regulator CheB